MLQTTLRTLRNQDKCRLIDVIIDPPQHLTVADINLMQLKMSRPPLIQELGGLRCILDGCALHPPDTPQ